MTATLKIEKQVLDYFKEVHDKDLLPKQLIVNHTSKQFDGEYTVVIFPFVKMLGQKPEELGGALGDYLIESDGPVQSYNVVKGFLNLVLDDHSWRSALGEINSQEDFGQWPSNGEKVLVEYSSPNTNKPLHLGHIRNILLGWSSAKILEASGFEVIKTQIVNDRGVAICKSMLAWQKFGNGETPESSGIKGDFLVGKYYVEFDKQLKAEYAAWAESDIGEEAYRAASKTDESKENFLKRYKNDYFNQHSTLGGETREMLLKWEDNDTEVRGLWKEMNGWVYGGFEHTYKSLGVHFDINYYESDTYVLGKETIEEGLAKGIFYKKDDGSVWIDLEDAKLDHKILQRGDGTSVYLTQDLGTCQVRYQDHGAKRMVYVVGDEQDYHFKVLFEVMKRLEAPYADGLYHLSYGMVDLPTGRMKSREGTVVDADDLIAEVLTEAQSSAAERGELLELPKEEQDEIIRRIAIGALKFFIIKVQPKKRMIFNPKESLDMQGQTGPYIQNAFVRVQSILRKFQDDLGDVSTYAPLQIEKELIRELVDYPKLILQAGKELDPSIIANYLYSLAKAFHKYYHDVRILKAETDVAKSFRINLIKNISSVLEKGMALLGIEMPSRM